MPASSTTSTSRGPSCSRPCPHVVMIGDPEQLQAIEAGAAFRSVTERHGAAEITESVGEDDAGFARFGLALPIPAIDQLAPRLLARVGRFRSVTERHGAAEITEIRRQREDWQRDATRALATGSSFSSRTSALVWVRMMRDLPGSAWRCRSQPSTSSPRATGGRARSRAATA
jgi:ATP-dependent exoDNAse (exonuclease V) alpha subunit